MPDLSKFILVVMFSIGVVFINLSMQDETNVNIWQFMIGFSLFGFCADILYHKIENRE